MLAGPRCAMTKTTTHNKTGAAGPRLRPGVSGVAQKRQLGKQLAIKRQRYLDLGRELAEKQVTRKCYTAAVPRVYILKDGPEQRCRLIFMLDSLQIGCKSSNPFFLYL